MTAVIEKWDRAKISTEGWTRYAIRPPDRGTGRELIARLRIWFVEHGRDKCMIHVVDHARYSTVAFSSKHDCVLFRLTFSEVPINLVKQPLCSDSETLRA